MGKPAAPMAVVSDEPDWKHLALTLAWSMALKGPHEYTTAGDDYPDVAVTVRDNGDGSVTYEWGG